VPCGIFMCTRAVGPRICIGPLSAEYGRHVFPGLVAERQITEFSTKHGLNDLSRTLGVVLIHCLTDMSGFKERDKIRLLPNPGELGFSFIVHLMFLSLEA